MNRRYIFVLMMVVAAFFAACQKDPQLESKTPEVTEIDQIVWITSAEFDWTVDYPGKLGSVVEISLKKDMSDAISYGSDTLTAEKKFVITATGLTENTKYYYRYKVMNSFMKYESEIRNFTTQAFSKPTVITSPVTNVTITSATCGGEVTDDGGADVTERGICWCTSSNPTINDSLANSGTGTGVFTVDLTGLTAGTTYYVRAYAVNNEGTSYGEEMSFTTAITKPTVTTSPITNITLTSATGGGEVTDDGGAEVTERGICWSTNQNPTVSDNHANSGTGTGVFTVDMTGLTEGTTYYVRAYAVNSEGTSYGEGKSFTAQPINKPTVTTSSITNISFTSATGNGEVTDDGGAEVIERGICWSTSHNPTVSDSHLSSGAGIGSYSVDMTGLTDAATYYVRAYAVNSKGTGYGEEKSFTTQLINKPTVTTSSVTNTTSSSATGGGEVTDDGGGEVTERGICWSTSHNPTVSDSHANSGTGTGSYSVDMSGLTDGTTYYVRAYALNIKGMSYGEEKSFTTEAINKPTVITSSITNIGYTSATGGGEVTDDGGAEVTERGICWSTSQNPTVSDSHVNSGTGTGEFTIDMTGLTDGVTYYVRAYAVNIKGMSYGEEKSFSTEAITKPTVVTSSITNVTFASAIGGGEVTDDGGAEVTERGICWSTSHSPTVSDNHGNNGAGTGAFTVEMPSLTEETVYYVRAYAVNSKGTSYGGEMNFKTPLKGAIIGIFSVSGSKRVYFSQGNLQYRAYSKTWRFAEQQYSVVGSDNHNISSSYNGWIDLFGWGTSGWNSGANCYQPWSTSTTYTDYYPGGSYSNSLTGSYAYADWGVYNTITNGNQEVVWRTLTNEEWVYVFNTRNTTSGIRFAKASVNSVKGVILLPDDWNSDYYSLNSTNSSDANFTTNIISESEWVILEQHGAVFLPAAGWRNGTSVNYLNTKGHYWSTSFYYSGNACGVFFDNVNLNPSEYIYRHRGLSVRLVHDVQ